MIPLSPIALLPYERGEEGVAWGAVPQVAVFLYHFAWFLASHHPLASGSRDSCAGECVIRK